MLSHISPHATINEQTLLITLVELRHANFSLLLTLALTLFDLLLLTRPTRKYLRSHVRSKHPIQQLANSNVTQVQRNLRLTPEYE